jgi:hypothetical protein
LGVFRREPVSTPKPTTPGGIRASVPVSNTLPQNSAFLKPVPNAATPVSYNAPRPLTAAASQMRIGDKSEAEQFKNRRSAASSAWQQEAWEYYDAIGEVKYAFNLVASVVSRIRLYPAVVSNPAESPSPIRNVEAYDQRLVAAAERALQRLDSAYGGQAGLLRDAALNLQVTGECYLSQIPQRPSDGTPESWDIRSVDEISVDSRGNIVIAPRRELKTAGGGSQKGVYLLPKGAFIGRIWKSHPRFSEEADSSMRGILDLCAELLLLNRTFRATARSRLNAGALYLPDGLSVAANPDPDFPYSDEDGIYNAPTPEELEDEFEDQLMDAMTTPIKDEDSASAVVPLIIRGPAELGDKIKQFKFERSFDPMLAARADRVLERIMQGLDVPKDIVSGLANVKYSNALQIDESLYKAHIEPLMLLIADALTIVYLRPYLLANGFSEPEVERIVVWYDPSQVATRNDRAADADMGFDKMAVSYETWRRTHGFSEAEAPSPTEITLRMLIEKGMITPELTEAMLGVVAPDVMEKIRGAAQAASPAPVPEDVSQMLQGEAPAGGEAPAEAPAPEGPPPGLAEPTPAKEEAPAQEPTAISPSDATPPLAEPTPPQGK